MKYALVIVDVPEETWRGDTAFCRNFANRFLDSGTNREKVAMLNPVSFLCDLSNGLHALGNLVVFVKEHDLHSRTLFFDQDPPWVLS